MISIRLQKHFDFDKPSEEQAEITATRSALISKARQLASDMADAKGTVTSTEVIEKMHALGYGPHMDQLDGRWLGSTLRYMDLVCVGHVRTGHRGRPVAIWRKP